jgi:hypothetical protein
LTAYDTAHEAESDRLNPIPEMLTVVPRAPVLGVNRIVGPLTTLRVPFALSMKFGFLMNPGIPLTVTVAPEARLFTVN